MSPRQGSFSLRRLRAGWGLVTAAAVFVTAALAAAPGARADESTWPTAQAVAAHAEWVPYLDPPPKPAAICLVDSGVNITPDTPADSPNGPILERSALDGGSGEGGTDDVHAHGTYMAMTAGAPINGWGTAGIWPGVRIVSIRVMPPWTQTFPFDDYQAAIRECELKAEQFHIVAVNLSLGCACDYDAAAQATLENRVADAHRANLNVLASAGNGGSSIGMPAGAPGVLSVGASDRTGRLCAYSNRGRDLDLIAPGCGLDGAWPTSGLPFSNWVGGTSPASAIASTVAVLLRSYQPNLSWSQTEQLIQHASRMSDAGPILDVEAAARLAGLGKLVDASKARMSTASPAAADAFSESRGEAPPSTAGNSAAATVANPTTTVFAKPRPPTPVMQRLVKRRRALTVSVSNRGATDALVAELQGQHGEFGYQYVSRARRARSAVRFRLPRRWRGGRLLLWYETARASANRSPTVVRHVPQ